MATDLDRYNEAMRLVEELRDAVELLTGISEDWVAVGVLDNRIDALEDEIRQFGRCNLGLVVGPDRVRSKD